MANYHQWEDLHKERRNLLEEVLPSLEYHEAREKAGAVSRNLREQRKPMAQADSQLIEKRNALAAQAKALTERSSRKRCWNRKGPRWRAACRRSMPSSSRSTACSNKRNACKSWRPIRAPTSPKWRPSWTPRKTN
ncbi:hypothetical protein LP419_15220 [Massilia sp. H-1]|nr:hypothetical protein LP419_15220 [Massilia sp. H-1]